MADVEGSQIGEYLPSNLDQLFLLFNTMIVFLMQGGFAYLETGSIQSKNVTNILMKNLLDAFIGAVAFVSGAVAERCKFTAYFIYSIFISGVIYPVASHLAWSRNGFFLTSGYQDFAGSGVVHVVGGSTAFVAAAILGPRIGRFDTENAKGNPISGHSIPHVAQGGFILFVGFLAFNGGSQLTISGEGDAEAVSRAVLNTIIGGSAGALTVTFAGRVTSGKWLIVGCINGGLAGMVALCAGCNVFQQWSSFVVGLAAGFGYMIVSATLTRWHVDDPLEACPVHWGAGMVGLIAQPIFRMEDGIVYNLNVQSFASLGWNVAGGLVLTLWCSMFAGILFGLLKLTGNFRVSEAVEVAGLDVPEHGEPAYNFDSRVFAGASPAIGNEEKGTEYGDTTTKYDIKFGHVTTLDPVGSIYSAWDDEHLTQVANKGIKACCFKICSRRKHP